jgi:hypothetical protein
MPTWCVGIPRNSRTTAISTSSTRFARRNFVHHLPIPGLPEGRAGFKALGQFVTGAIGDITVTIELIVANRNRAHGTRKADGKEMNWIEHEFWRVENGQLAEQWSVADRLDIG